MATPADLGLFFLSSFLLIAKQIDSFDPQNQQNRPKLHRNSSLFALPQATAEQIDSFDPQNQQNRPKRPQLFALRHPPSHRSSTAALRSSPSPKPPQNRSIHSIPKTSKTDPSHCSSSPSPKPPQLHRSSSLFVLPQATAALRPSPSPKPPQLHRSSSLSALPQATAAPPRLCLRLPLLRAFASKRRRYDAGDCCWWCCPYRFGEAWWSGPGRFPLVLLLLGFLFLFGRLRLRFLFFRYETIPIDDNAQI
ncbi:formin-like protein 18 [Rosa rugosa]|uniref:formin-like protein 18 n=1 Tax=Rosa rugosa TaxID=74645 RepID=UPI002B405F19|nr:formin-like protein 18 [Rosa rugosa]